MPSYRPDPRILELGDAFFDQAVPATFPRHTIRFRNQRWADRIGLGSLNDTAFENYFARFQPLPDNLQEPLALRYHGYQFRSYNPHLGDGRGFLFAQVRDAEPPRPSSDLALGLRPAWSRPPRGARKADDRLLDLGTKGSGQTRWSRNGDGRLTLKGGVREVLATEMLEALGVNTSKSFSLFETGEPLERGDEPSPTRSSVLVRLSHSHIRFGTFERQAHERNHAALKRLCDYTCEYYFPELGDGDPAQLFRAICQRSAELCASWMVAGFVHGVLNTDNMNVTGESFDYGPWRFLPHLDPMFTAAYFDHSRLYAYGRQPETVRWNLERLADALSPLVPASQLTRSLVDFEARVLTEHTIRFLQRLGVEGRDPVSDAILSSRALCFLERSRVPFDRFFFDWYGGEVALGRALKGPQATSYAGDQFTAFRHALDGRAPRRPSLLRDPYFERSAPVTMHIDEVERVWSAIADKDDWSAFEQKITEVRDLGRQV